MQQKQLLVIGAGLAGLAAGIYCQLSGCRSILLEQHDKPGGVCTAWKRGDYLFDGGVHFLMGYREGQFTHDLYRELGIIAQTDLAEMSFSGRYYDEASGKYVDLTKDLDRFAQDLAHLSPVDKKTIDGFIRSAKRFRGVDSMRGLADAPGLAGIWKKLSSFSGMYKVLPYFVGAYGKRMGEFSSRLNDAFVRFVFDYLFLPDVPVWFSLNLLGLLADGQLASFQQGSLAFARDLETRYTELGGEIRYRAKVEKVLVEQDRAVGVCLADGEEIHADGVISAADGHSTCLNLMDSRYVPDSVSRRFDEWELTCPIMTLCYGAAREFKEAPSLGLVQLAEPLQVGTKRVSGFYFRVFNYSPHFAVAGKTSIVASIETDYEFWRDLRKNDRDAYRKAKQELSDAILQKLENYLPGLTESLEVTDTSSPETFVRYTSNYRGAYEGFLPNPENIFKVVERTLPGLKDFYMAGQWVMPGGGIPPSLLSGRHAVQLFCHDHEIPFHSHS